MHVEKPLYAKFEFRSCQERRVMTILSQKGSKIVYVSKIVLRMSQLPHPAKGWQKNEIHPAGWSRKKVEQIAPPQGCAEENLGPPPV